MTSKRSVKTMLKRARLATKDFTVSVGGEEMSGTLTALPFMKWQELLAAHPPRPDNQADEGWGFSVSTFWPAVVRACMTDPVMDDEDWDIFEEVMSQGDMFQLGTAAFTLNVRPGEVSVPKLRSASAETEQPSSA